MKVIYDIKEFDPKKPVVLTQGTFDGVHFGHRKILRHVVSESREMDGVCHCDCYSEPCIFA